LNGFSYGFKLEINGDGKWTKHKGEIFSLGNGKSLKGPITLPNCISFAIFKSTISLTCLIPTTKKFQSMQAFQMKQQLFNKLVLMMQ
jgi:hypothetical protein